MTALEQSLTFTPENLWVYFARLLHLRQVTLVSGFKRAKLLNKILYIGLVLLTLAVAVGCYLLTDAVLGELNSPILAQSGIDLANFINAIPPLILAAVFMLTMMSSFRVLLQALYLARDMDFLVSAPIPIRAVFLSKFVEAILPNFILVLVFALPVLLSIGVARGYHIAYFPLLLVVMAFLSLAAAGISSLMVMAVVRLFPAKRIAEVLTFVGACLILLVSQAFNLISGSLENLTGDQLAYGANLFGKLNNAWFPLIWGGKGLVELGSGNWSTGTIFLILTMILSGFVFCLSLITAEKLYYSGWASLQVETSRNKNHRQGKDRQENQPRNKLVWRWLPAQIGAVVVKDFKLIRRDLNNLSQVIGALIVGVVFGVMLLRANINPASSYSAIPAQFAGILQAAMLYGSMVIGLFVGWCLISRLALVAFSMEGRSYWILKTAPISPTNLLSAKFLMAFTPALFVGWFYLVVISVLQKPPLAIILYGLPSIALVMSGTCGIYLALGIRCVNLTWTDPRKMESGVAGIAGTIISIVYQLVTLVLFFGPPLGFPLLGLSENLGMLAGLLAGGSVTLLCTFLPLKMIKNRVSHIGEE